MIKPNPSLKDIEQNIRNASFEKQRQLLKHLPHLLKISSGDIAMLKTAEPSFDFWNNPDDAIYDDF